MKTAAIVSFALMLLFFVGMFVLFGFCIWLHDARYGWLGVLALVAGGFLSFVGAFFASRAGLGVKK